MKLLLVVNPSASSVTARTRIVIQKALSADHRLEVAATSRRGHATRLAQSAAHDGFDLVVVLGRGLAAGIGIVLMAIIIDRISLAWTKKQRIALGLEKN